MVATPRPSAAATCFCQVLADGQEVAKPSKGGFVQGVQKEACRNYCRGVWDSKSSADLAAWAKLSGKCGDISLKMNAAIGTANYQEVRSTTVNVPCAPAGPASCNLIQNGDFAAGLQVSGSGSMPGSKVAGWTAAFASPQLSATAGCGGGVGFVSMWGNQVVGEAIQQVLSAPLVPGRTYRLSACVRWLNNNPALPQYVRFRARLSNGPLSSYTAPGTLVGIFGQPSVAQPDDQHVRRLQRHGEPGQHRQSRCVPAGAQVPHHARRLGSLQPLEDGLAHGVHEHPLSASPGPAAKASAAAGATTTSPADPPTVTVPGRWS
jgi:hypothetical protein